MPALEISRLPQALSSAKVIFCDIWGVLHNGVAAFPEASQALVAARRKGVPVVLLSNAPRPGINVLPQLAALGVDRNAFDDIVTSGDVCQSIIETWQPKRFHHLGPERDAPLFLSLGHQPVAPEQADYVLCTGLLNDAVETPEDYRDRLAGFAARGLPMLCANPDLVIDRGGKEIYCAGALAQLFQSLGGTATIIGKPFRAAYEHAMKKARTLTGKELLSSDVLAIGDSFRTDIAGAAGFGAQSLFIAAGIHASDFLGQNGMLDSAKAAAAFEKSGYQPHYVMAQLA